MTDVAMVAPPDDGSDGVGTYTGDLIASFPDEVDARHVSFPAGTSNPIPVLRASVAAGRSGADVVHVQHEYGLFGPVSVGSWSFFALLFVLARLAGSRIVVTLHSAWSRETVAGESLEGLKRAYVLVNNAMLAAVADRLVFLSENCLDTYRTTVSPDDPAVFTHGVRTDAVREFDRPEVRASFGYAPDDALVVEPGFVRHQKGQHVLVDVARELPDVEFLLAGGAQDPTDREYVEGIEARARSNVRITGRLSDERFHAAFAAADLVCLPYLRMTQSGIFNWCAAYGVPVAASDHEYFVRMRDRWDNVVVFDPDDPRAVAETLESVLESPDRRRELSAEMDAFADANSFRRVAADHLALYRDLA